VHTNAGEREVFDDLAVTTVLGRVGEPREVAELIGFLASPRASFITGTNVAIDSGRDGAQPPVVGTPPPEGDTGEEPDAKTCRERVAAGDVVVAIALWVFTMSSPAAIFSPRMAPGSVTSPQPGRSIWHLAGRWLPPRKPQPVGTAAASGTEYCGIDWGGVAVGIEISITL
jgi:hypothetical protein